MGEKGKTKEKQTSGNQQTTFMVLILHSKSKAHYTYQSCSGIKLDSHMLTLQCGISLLADEGLSTCPLTHLVLHAASQP